MKSFFIVVFIVVFSSFSIHAHRGTILAIENVKISSDKGNYIYGFQIENIVEKRLKGVQIEFWVNGKAIREKYFEVYTNNPKFQTHFFRLSKNEIQKGTDTIQIEITKIFDKINDWGGWDAPLNLKQTNTISSEFYVDAPWRMKKTDAAGNDLPVPLHFFLHDADYVIGYTLKIDYINVKVKNATNSSFGSILTYNNISTTALNSMFSCLSPADPDLYIKAFDLNSFTPTSSYTFDFDKEADFWDDYVSIEEAFWYFTFNIPPTDLVGLENVIDLEVTISYANTLITTDDVLRMRVFRSDLDIPSQADYYRGDTHVHSMFTQNDSEVGLSMCGTKEAAQLIGLDWMTTTDHTSDFDNYGSGNINANWALIQEETEALNSNDASMLFIAGQEVAVNNSENELVHMLAYPSFNDPMGLPFLGDGDGDLDPTSVYIDDVVSQLVVSGGFSYCAHPFATNDELSFLVGGGIWNLGNDGFLANGDDFPQTGGSIICNDLGRDSDVLSSSSNKLVKDAIRGCQIWNERETLEISGFSGDELDGWDVTNTGAFMSQVDTASFDFHFKRFRQGQEIVNHINLQGLTLKNSDSTYQNWKMYYSGGSDAHGSFNFTNTENTGGIGKITNTALGKVNTIAYCPNGMGVNGSEVLKALYNGNISMSDGPVLNIGISSDGNNNSNEILMGEDIKIDPSTENNHFLNIHYTTTVEFGEITKLTFIVGTDAGVEYKKAISIPSNTGDNVISYRLIDIMDSIFGSGNTPIDEYVYLRAEVETFKDYSSSVDLYHTDYDFFHAITNPIWINWTDLPDQGSGEIGILALYPNPSNDVIKIELTNSNDYTLLSVYNEIGQLVIQQPITSNNIPLDLNKISKGIYSLVIQGIGKERVVEKFVKY